MNFELNIHKYKKEELEDIFELPKNYGVDIIEMRETKLRKSVESNNEISEALKMNTILFLTEAKKILIENNSNNDTLLSFDKDVFNMNTNILKKSEINTNSGEAFIIERKPTTPYLNAEPSNYFPGTLNPLNKRITRQNLNIDTRFRDNYYGSLSTNFNLELPVKFSNVVSMQLTAFEFPVTFYTISENLGNNYFNIIINTTPTPIPILIIIPDGNYMTSDFITLLNKIVADDVDTTHIKNLKFELDIYNQSGSGRMFISMKPETDSDFHATFTLDFASGKNGLEDNSNPLPLKLGWLMGFRQGIYTGLSQYVSEGLVDLVGARYLYLVIDEYSNSVNDSFYAAFTQSVLNKNILARISINAYTFQAISQNNLMLVTHPRQYFGPIDIQNMKIQLLDEYGRIHNMNNMDYSFCLTFESIYNL